MPLCKENRTNCDGGREYSCLDEHITTQHDALMCKTVKQKKRQPNATGATNLSIYSTSIKKTKFNIRGTESCDIEGS